MQGINVVPKIQAGQDKMDLEAAALARAYALILSWSPTVEASIEQDVEAITAEKELPCEGSGVEVEEHVDN